MFLSVFWYFTQLQSIVFIPHLGLVILFYLGFCQLLDNARSPFAQTRFCEHNPCSCSNSEREAERSPSIHLELLKRDIVKERKVLTQGEKLSLQDYKVDQTCKKS